MGLISKNTLCKIIQNINPKAYVEIMYFKRFKKKLNLKNPKGFNEKILWLIINKYGSDPLVIQSADKYRLREFAYSRMGEKAGAILPKLYGAYDDANDINFDLLPNEFVLKCNHGSGMNIICTSKDTFDREKAIEKLNSWLKEDFGVIYYEPHYQKMKRKIIAEEYIRTTAGVLPNDYKIYCFDGVAKIILVCSERSEKLRLEWYDLDWNILDIGVKPNQGRATRPKCLSEMIRLAETLSKGFPYVRVDFYDKDNCPILGEMTFTPMYGMAKYYSENGNMWLGEFLDLPIKDQSDRKVL